MVSEFFNPRQKLVIAAATTLLATGVIVMVVITALWLVGLFFSSFSKVFLPLVTAGILALILKPWYEWIYRHTRKQAWLAVIGVLISILAPLMLAVWFLAPLLIHQISEMFARLSHVARDVGVNVQGHWPQIMEWLHQYGVKEKIGRLLQDRSDLLAAGAPVIVMKAVSAGASIFGAITGVLNWAVMPVYLVFFLAMRPVPHERVERWFSFLKVETRRMVLFLVTEFGSIITSFFRGQMLIAGLQGMLYALGFVAVGLQYGFVIGLTLGFLNIIPYLGSITGLAVALPIAFFQSGGGWGEMALVLVVFTAVQSVDGMFITPRIMADRTGLHPLAVMVSIFFWGAALNGILGMMLAVPLSAFLVVFFRLIKSRYLKELL